MQTLIVLGIMFVFVKITFTKIYIVYLWRQEILIKQNET